MSYNTPPTLDTIVWGYVGIVLYVGLSQHLELMGFYFAWKLLLSS